MTFFEELSILGLIALILGILYLIATIIVLGARYIVNKFNVTIGPIGWWRKLSFDDKFWRVVLIMSISMLAMIIPTLKSTLIPSITGMLATAYFSLLVSERERERKNS